MNQSTNYDLKLYEGGDKFNPLSVEVYNNEIVDNVIHENELASVGTATEILSGTVHAILRDKPDTAMFRFVATSDFTFGDSFTVDGIAYTAKMSNGEQMNTDAFVTGANVLCCLEGTELTFFVASTGVAPDSNRLGGQLPSYYAKETDMAQAKIDILDNASDIADIVESNTVPITGSLGIGATSVTLIDARIKTTSVVEPWQYVPADGNPHKIIYPTLIALSSGQCVLTYEAQSEAYTVGIRVF